MGCTSSQLFGQLFDKYENQLVKLIIAEKSKQTLDQKYNQASDTLDQKISLFKNKVNSVVDSKQSAIKQKLQELKTSINQKVPGGLAVFERVKGKSINQLSQFDKIQAQIHQIRQKSLAEVDQKKQQLQNQLLSKKNILRQQIQKQRPKVPVYQQLPQNLRFKIANEAIQKFQKQIKEGNIKNSQKFDSEMNLNDLDIILQKLSPQAILRNFVKDSIKKMIQNVGGGKLAGIIDRIF